MKRFLSTFCILCILLATVLSQGCVYDMAMEERNVGDYMTDQKISFIINEKFLEDDNVKFRDFDASTFEGHVYIVGEYESREQVARAVEIAKSVEGVTRVTTYMMPKKVNDDCGTSESIDIHASLTNALVGDDTISSSKIDIEIVQCNIILLGIVGSEAEKTAVEGHAHAIPNARGVKSYLTVKQ